MILRQFLFFLAAYFFREKMGAPSGNWFSDSSKALTYSTITTVFINKLNILLRKSILVIPLTVFASVLGLFCYIDLMSYIDSGSNLAPSFYINLVFTLICFVGVFFVMKDSKETKVAEPISDIGSQVTESFTFFKRGFEQGLNKVKVYHS